MQHNDTAYLLDMLLAARKAIGYLEDLSWDDFLASELHQDAAMRALEIIGEAANRISETTKNEHPEVPWMQVIGMRNRLIHEYFRINLVAVWDTVKRDLQELIVHIEPLIPNENDY
jgi:uncharacterized protein with HEPN domain